MLGRVAYACRVPVSKKAAFAIYSPTISNRRCFVCPLSRMFGSSLMHSEAEIRQLQLVHTFFHL